MPPILYEDKNIIAFDKPTGLMVHGDGRSKEKTLVDFILEKFPKMKNVGEKMEITDPATKKKIKLYRPGIVHRLDKETSGVIIVAKNQKTFEYLKEQFKGRSIKKTYHAIVAGNIRDNDGTVDMPIGRSKNDFRKWLAGRGTRGETRDAVTYYRVLKRLEINKVKCTYLEIHPKTGRTHQIRVHMKYLNHPVLCDDLYYEKGICPKPLKRLALHAHTIDLKLPNGKPLHVESALPAEFAQILAKA